MTTAHAPSATTLRTRVAAGVLGGLVGGLAFGILMQMMGKIGMIAQLVGSRADAVGWLVHLFNSALFGAIFALAFGRWLGRRVLTVLLGMAYGAAWWIFGALLIMPAWLGMSDMILAVNATSLQSLMGHLIYGLLLAVVSMLAAPLLQRN